MIVLFEGKFLDEETLPLGELTFLKKNFISDGCVFKPGIGDGETVFSSYSLTGEACVQKCITSKKNNPAINGAAIFSDGRLGNCYFLNGFIVQSDNLKHYLYQGGILLSIFLLGQKIYSVVRLTRPTRRKIP